jgi:hypothetical protein
MGTRTPREAQAWCRARAQAGRETGAQAQCEVAVQTRPRAQARAPPGARVQARPGAGAQGQRGVGIRARSGSGVQARYGVAVQARRRMRAEVRREAGVQARHRMRAEVRREAGVQGQRGMQRRAERGVRARAGRGMCQGSPDHRSPRPSRNQAHHPDQPLASHPPAVDRPANRTDPPLPGLGGPQPGSSSQRCQGCSEQRYVPLFRATLVSPHARSANLSRQQQELPGRSAQPGPERHFPSRI